MARAVTRDDVIRPILAQGGRRADSWPAPKLLASLDRESPGSLDWPLAYHVRHQPAVGWPADCSFVPHTVLT
jgi:hypothetical protein